RTSSYPPLAHKRRTLTTRRRRWFNSRSRVSVPGSSASCLRRLNSIKILHRLVLILHLHRRFRLLLQKGRNNCRVKLLRFLKIQISPKGTTKRTPHRRAAEAGSSTS